MEQQLLKSKAVIKTEISDNQLETQGKEMLILEKFNSLLFTGRMQCNVLLLPYS